MSTSPKAKTRRKAAIARPAKPAPTSRAAAKEASREALIAAATALFAERGLDVSLDEVCAHAGYTRGAFYVHFAGRDDLIAAVMARIGAGLLDAMVAPASSESVETIVRRFSRRLRRGAHPVTKEGGVRPYQLFDACARSPAIHDQYLNLVAASAARIGETLRANQRSRAMRRDIDARHAAALLEAMVIGFEVLHDLDAPIDLDGCAETLIKLLRA